MLARLLPLVLACTPDIRSLYDAERAIALAVASDTPSAWHPDLSVQIATPAFESVVETAVSAALSADRDPIKLSLMIATAELRPKLTARKAQVSPSNACAACLAFDTDINGKVRWEVGGVGASFPLDLSAKGAMELRIVEGKRLEARVHHIGKIALKLKDIGDLKANPSEELQGWIRDALSDRLPPIPLTELDTRSFPARDLRIVTSGDALSLEVLTDVPGAKPVAPLAVPKSGFQLLVSESALTGLARRQAFEAGKVAYEVAIDPRAIHVDGTEFTMGLRLWRLVGRGWWRDYTITGTLGVADGKVKLTPKDVVEAGKSRGADFVDPLVALVQARILDAIADAIDRSLPAHKAATVAGTRMRAVVTAVRGQDETLVVSGTLTAEAPR